MDLSIQQAGAQPAKSDENTEIFLLIDKKAQLSHTQKTISSVTQKKNRIQNVLCK